MLQQELPICLCLPLPPWQVKRIGVNLQLGQYLGARDKVEEGRKPVAEGEENRAGEPETPEECSNAREVGRGDNLCCPETGWSENLHYTSKDTHYINLVQKETVPAVSRDFPSVGNKTQQLVCTASNCKGDCRNLKTHCHLTWSRAEDLMYHTTRWK
ncbi:hypothetical protein Y1Q_0001697 [Alligator mississippiensis]|uniref:Uncharacterized protein n=1 Tax=Alligator mississippiensis TaxID=8496 RepID=A0A151MAK0_ALLMI|nr:hypothetical protein Y1Q_0001697 [Alligator mississippiensis]